MQQIVHAVEIIFLVLVKQLLEFFLQQLGMCLDKHILASRDELLRGAVSLWRPGRIHLYSQPSSCLYADTAQRDLPPLAAG